MMSPEAYVVRPWVTSPTGSVRTNFGLHISTSFPTVDQMLRDPGRVILGLKSPCCGASLEKLDDGRYRCAEAKCLRPLPAGVCNHSLLESYNVDPGSTDSHQKEENDVFTLRPNTRHNCILLVAAATDPIIAPLILASFEDALGQFLKDKPWHHDRKRYKFTLPLLGLP